MELSVIIRIVASVVLVEVILVVRHKRTATRSVMMKTVARVARAAEVVEPPKAESDRCSLADVPEDSPLKALASRANMLRWVTHEPDLVGRRRNRLDVAGHLVELLDVPVTATVKRGERASDGLLRFDGEVLALRVTHGEEVQLGTVQVFFRCKGSQVSFITSVDAVEHGFARLAIPTSLEQYDCRGTDRRSLVEGRQQLGLVFRPDGRDHDFMVLDVSNSGIAMLVVGRDAVPALGDELEGDLVFEDEVLVKLRLNVRHLTTSLDGTRVGLRVTELDRATPYELQQVVYALAA